MSRTERKDKLLAKLDGLARKLQAHNPRLSYSQAYSEIIKQYPKTYAAIRQVVSKGE